MRVPSRVQRPKGELYAEQPRGADEESTEHVRGPVDAEVEPRVEADGEHHDRGGEGPPPVSLAPEHEADGEEDRDAHNRVAARERRPLVLPTVRPELRTRAIEQSLEHCVEDEAACNGNHQLERQVAAPPRSPEP